MDLVQKRNLKGLLFVLPFIIGFLVFFIAPLVTSAFYSFGDLDPHQGYKLIFKGMANYHRALFEDAQFNRMLVQSVQAMAAQVPIILIFSFLVATMIKSSFPGRAAIRAILFLPVILTSGIVSSMENNDLVQGLMTSAMSDASSVLVSTDSLQHFLLNLNFPAGMASYVMSAVTGIFGIINRSGIQILIFLAALQSISPALYEASSIEGATSWDNFWKITLPMVTPQMMVCLVYTIIDLFVDVNNTTMQYIYNFSFVHSQFGFASAMSWIYFMITVVVLAVYTGIISRFVLYYES